MLKVLFLRIELFFMRVIGQLSHPVLKITVFKLNMKFAVKFEAGMMEQTYKMRESDQLSSLKDIDNLIDEDFKTEVLERFKVMNASINGAFKRNL